MTLDYHFAAPGGPTEGSIAETDLPALLPAFTALERKTGVFIDPYGDTRLYPDHARLLLALLEESEKSGAPAFRRDLHTATECNAVMYFSGD